MCVIYLFVHHFDINAGYLTYVKSNSLLFSQSHNKQHIYKVEISICLPVLLTDLVLCKEAVCGEFCHKQYLYQYFVAFPQLYCYRVAASTYINPIHVINFKEASGRFFFHFLEVFKKCIEYIRISFIHFLEISKFW